MILNVKSMDCFSLHIPPKQPKNEAIPLKIQGFGTEPINIKPRYVLCMFVCKSIIIVKKKVHILEKYLTIYQIRICFPNSRLKNYTSYLAIKLQVQLNYSLIEAFP